MPSPSNVRLAEIVAALSLGIDLGFGQPMEHVLRQCLIALRIAELLDLDEQQRSTVYYSAMLVNVGCHSDAHEQAKWFGDDIAMKETKYDHAPKSLAGAAAMLRMLGSGETPLHRFRVGLEFAISGHREVESMIDSHSELARQLAVNLGLNEDVQRSVFTAYERWDGKGWPGKLGGEDVPVASRIAQFAEFAEVAHRVGGLEGAAELARRRSGSQFDPAVATCAVQYAQRVFENLHPEQTWGEVIDAEPALRVQLDDDQTDAALSAVSDFVDLKSPFTLGHGRAVANLAAQSARRLGLSDDERVTVTRAALVHGFGRMGVSNAILDKSGPLGAGELERLRMVPYLTERMLKQSAALAPYGALGAQIYERLDGSGYPRGIGASGLNRSARLLAAADSYQTAIEPRPGRDAMSGADAARRLKSAVQDGQLDGEAVEAVLQSAGHRVSSRREGPAGLTSREIEVLRLTARGNSAKQVAAQLVISVKTARNHIDHIYAKIGAINRAQASLFAVTNGLLYDEDVAAEI